MHTATIRAVMAFQLACGLPVVAHRGGHEEGRQVVAARLKQHSCDQRSEEGADGVGPEGAVPLLDVVRRLADFPAPGAVAEDVPGPARGRVPPDRLAVPALPRGQVPSE